MSLTIANMERGASRDGSFRAAGAGVETGECKGAQGGRQFSAAMLHNPREVNA